MDIFEIIRQGNIESLNEAIKKGADVNAADLHSNTKKTPLHYAAIYNNLEAIKALKNAGAYFNAVDDEGNTPLHYAVDVDNPDIKVIQELLNDESINVNATNKQLRTPLHTTVIRNGRLSEIVKTLIEAKAKFNARDYEGKTALSIAENNWNSNPETIKLLKKYGAKLNPDKKEEQFTRGSDLKLLTITQIPERLEERRRLTNRPNYKKRKKRDGRPPLYPNHLSPHSFL